MILFTLTLIAAAAIIALAIAFLSVCGAGAIFVFGDIFVCVWLLKKLINWYKRHK